MNKLIIIPAIILCHSAVSSAETQLTLSPSLLLFDYTEFSTSDQILDNESGWLPGVEARLHHKLADDWSIGFYTSIYRGTVDYDGETQSGTAHSTDTETRLFRLGAQLDKVILKNTGVFIAAQSHQWKRDIQDNNNVSGITETYDWLEYSAGINYRVNINNKDAIKLDAGLLIIRNADIYVDLSRVNLGSTTLDIGDGTGGRLNLAWGRQHNASTEFGAGAFFEAWNFGRSNTKPMEGGSTIVYVTEPRSETRNFGLRLYIKYSI